MAKKPEDRHLSAVTSLAMRRAHSAGSAHTGPATVVATGDAKPLLLDEDRQPTPAGEAKPSSLPPTTDEMQHTRRYQQIGLEPPGTRPWCPAGRQSPGPRWWPARRHTGFLDGSDRCRRCRWACRLRAHSYKVGGARCHRRSRRRGRRGYRGDLGEAVVPAGRADLPPRCDRCRQIESTRPGAHGRTARQRSHWRTSTRTGYFKRHT